MKQIPTREQVLDALATHKSVQKAANSLGLKYPEMQKYLRKYGICTNHNVKDYKFRKHGNTVPIDKAMQELNNSEEEGKFSRWLKNLFKKGE